MIFYNKLSSLSLSSCLFFSYFQLFFFFYCYWFYLLVSACTDCTDFVLQFLASCPPIGVPWTPLQWCFWYAVLLWTAFFQALAPGFSQRLCVHAPRAEKYARLYLLSFKFTDKSPLSFHCRVIFTTLGIILCSSDIGLFSVCPASIHPRVCLFG